jgi:fatty-acyl-CoA synthase
VITHPNVAKILWQAYQEIPDQVALTLLFSQASDLPISHQALFESSAGYARSLYQAAIQPGEVVILILQHGPDLISAFFGSILHGAIPSIMPFLTEKLLPDHYRRTLEALFEITSPAAVITYPEFVPEVQAASQAAHRPRAILVSDQIHPCDIIDPKDLPGLERDIEEIVLLQHSSGTTGLQKGVALSHQAIFNQLTSYSEALHIKSSDVVVSWLPLYHDMGLIAGFIMPILSRLHLVLISPFDWVRAPYKLMQAISKYHGTLTWLPNFAYNFCAQKIRARDLEGVDLSTLRAVINCSEPMYYQSHQLFLDRFQPYGLRHSALATCYAMAENVFAVTQGGISTPVTIDSIDALALMNRQVAEPVKVSSYTDPTKTIKMLSAGRPIHNTQVRILDQHGKDLPERKIGEIAIHSDCMLTGYYHRPDLTEKAFLDGWYLTGDLGYLAQGELYVTGRKKDLIIVGGKNIYPQDLEILASEVNGVHPGRVVAVGILNDSTGTEDVMIIAELDDYEELTEDAREKISQEIRQRVTQGSDIVLRYVYLVRRNWLLKTSSGKIARAANREKYQQEIN